VLLRAPGTRAPLRLPKRTFGLPPPQCVRDPRRCLQPGLRKTRRPVVQPADQLPVPSGQAARSFLLHWTAVRAQVEMDAEERAMVAAANAPAAAPAAAAPPAAAAAPPPAAPPPAPGPPPAGDDVMVMDEGDEPEQMRIVRNYQRQDRCAPARRAFRAAVRRAAGAAVPMVLRVRELPRRPQPCTGSQSLL